MTSENTGFLTVRAGTFQRTTRTTVAAGAFRAVTFSHCPVTQWMVIGTADSDKLDGHSFSKGEKLQLLTVYEKRWDDPLWKEDPEKIGAIGRDDMFANVYVPPEAFADFWNAAEAQLGSIHSVELALKPGSPVSLSVTNIGLFEAMPSPPVSVTGDRLAPMHPVVAELQTMRGKLAGNVRLILTWVFVVGAVWVVVALFR